MQIYVPAEFFGPEHQKKKKFWMSALAPAGCLDTIGENLPSYGNHKPLLSKIQASAIS